MKKFSAIILAVLLAFVCIMPAFATDETGTININNAVTGNTYKVYQILDLESYDTDTGAYSYKATSAWSSFINSADIKDVYVEVTNGYVTWKTGAAVADFAAKAIAYASANSITETASKDAESTTVSFTGLDLGYYLVDSSLGTICSLNTTNPTATIEEKNDIPTVVKKIVETDGSLVDSNTATIGDIVNYNITVTVQDGAQNYAIHDTMEAGLTLDTTSFAVKQNNADVATANYTITTPGADGDTFDIAFNNSYISTLSPDDTIVVTYSATLNSNAVIATESNDNTVNLTYGEKNAATADSTVTTYTYSAQVVKTNSSNAIITGAKFRLYDAAENGNEIKVAKTADGQYKVDPTGAGVDIEAGTATISGLGAGTYYLEEIAAPEGYNELDARQSFTITNANLTATTDGTTYTSGGVQVINQTGSVLPTTGGIGTTIFYVAGAILVLIAIAYVITKRKSAVKEG